MLFWGQVTAPFDVVFLGLTDSLLPGCTGLRGGQWPVKATYPLSCLPVGMKKGEGGWLPPFCLSSFWHQHLR